MGGGSGGGGNGGGGDGGGAGVLELDGKLVNMTPETGAFKEPVPVSYHVPSGAKYTIGLDVILERLEFATPQVEMQNGEAPDVPVPVDDKQPNCGFPIQKSVNGGLRHDGDAHPNNAGTPPL
jgi:hypothetical protein